MLNRKLIVSACAAAMFASVTARPAFAQGGPADSRTEFTFNNPVEMPGVTLPPGTYVFRFADATTSRQVMQVVAKDGSNKTYGLFMTINAQRPKASDAAELRFLETPEGKPSAVKTWWYPGTSSGREFIYPKSQARRLAMATKTNVLTTKEETVANDKMASADLSYVSPSGQETEAIDQVVSDMNKSVATSGTLDRTPAQESTSANMARAPRQSLPRTNGMLPMLALLGVSSLAGGTSLRFRR